MHIYNNILEIKDNFDIFLFDAFGVFWDGSNIYKNADIAMEQLIKEGKTICILSNSPRHILTSEAYFKHGFKNGKHFNYFITSGIVLRDSLENHKLKFKNNKNPKNVYIFGFGGKTIFEGIDFNIVNNLKEADFVYIASPKLIEDEYNKSTHKKFLNEAVNTNIQVWNSTKIYPFVKNLKEILESGLPILNANPDITARDGVKNTKNHIFAIKGGAIANYLRKKGAEVVEFGKPHKITYDFALEHLKNHGISINNKSKICMVGDTLRTDIKGANNVGIKSVLCVETGVTAGEIENGKNLEEMIKSENVKVDYFIKGVGIGI